MPSSCLKIDRSRTRQNTPDASSSSSSSAEAAAVPMAPLVDIDRNNQFHHNARWWILCSCCRCLSKSRWAERRAVTQVELWWPSIGQDGCNQPCLIAVQRAGSTIEASAVRTEFTLWRQAIKCSMSRVIQCSFWHDNLVTLQYYCIFYCIYLLILQIIITVVVTAQLHVSQGDRWSWASPNHFISHYISTFEILVTNIWELNNVSISQWLNVSPN